MTAHPYMANSVPELKQEMLDAIGAGQHRGALRPDPGVAPPPRRARPAARAHLRGRALAPLARPARPQRELRGQPELPGRRLLAAPRPRGVRRGRAPLRVRDARVGHARLRLRAQPGVVRVLQPARRAARARLRRPARLQLGLRRRPRRSGWRPGSTAAARCSCPPHSIPERLAVIRTYCEPREMESHLDLVLVDFDPGHRTAGTGRSGTEALGPHGGGLLREPLVPRRRSRPTPRRSSGSRTTRAPRRSPASTRSRSACSRRPATGAPTSRSARSSRSACT